MITIFHRQRFLGALALFAAAFFILGLPRPTHASVSPPAVTAAEIQDMNGDGYTDTIVMTFDQALNNTAAGANGFDVDGGGSDEHGDCTGESADPDGTTTLVLTFTCTNQVTAVEDMSVTLTSNSGVTGTFGNVSSFTLNSGSSPALTDNAAPQLREGVYQDQDGDGKIDTMYFYFTETVDGGEGGAHLSANDLLFTDVGDFTGAAFGGNTTDLLTTNVTGVSVTLGTEATVVDTNEGSGDIAISSQNAFDLADLYGNVNTTLGAQAQMSFLDNAAPVIKTAEYDGTGGVDVFNIGFSETVDASSVLAHNDLGFADDGDFNGISFGAGGTDLITTSVSIVGVTLATTVLHDSHDDSGTLSILTQNGFDLFDADGNENDTLGEQTQAEILDGSEPYLDTVTYGDDNADGQIDMITMTFTETLDAASHLSASDLVFSNVGDFTGADFGSDTTDLITGSTDFVNIALGTEASVVDTHDDTELMRAVTSGDSDLDLFDGINHRTDLDLGLGEYTTVDGADAVVKSVSPADGGTATKTAAIFLTFSETMDTTFTNGESGSFEISPNVGDYVVSWSESDSKVQIAHASFACDDAVTVTTHEGEIFDAANEDTLLTSGPQDGDWTYDVTCSSGGGGGGGSTTETGTEATIDLVSPVSGALTIGAMQTVTWTTGGSGISSEKLELSLDGGVNYTLVASGLTGGSYVWTVPDSPTTNGRLRISALDSGSATVASDTSGVLTINATGTEETPSEPLPDGVTVDSEGRHVAPSSGVTGPSPFNGETENISAVTAGWYIRSYNYSTVYRVEADGTRRPFWDATTFFTWATSWNDVIWVTDATLATMPLGNVMLPKAGVVLVKVTSDPKVYAIENDEVGNPTLRWVSSETIASEMYGSAWADYVIDLEPTTMAHFGAGDDITFAETIDLSIMKTRAQLAALAS